MTLGELVAVGEDLLTEMPNDAPILVMMPDGSLLSTELLTGTLDDNVLVCVATPPWRKKVP